MVRERKGSFFRVFPRTCLVEMRWGYSLEDYSMWLQTMMSGVQIHLVNTLPSREKKNHDRDSKSKAIKLKLIESF